MQTARERLAGLGLAIAGSRGKFSNAGKAQLAADLAAGMTFSDWPKDKASTKPVRVGGKKTVSVPKAKTDLDVDPQTDIAYRFTEDEWKAIETRDGKRVERSLRAACNNAGCGVSLVVCYCSAPQIVAHDGNGSVAVKIERR